MKVEKNKIVFALVLLSVLVFMIAYYIVIFGDEGENGVNKDQIPLPELGEGQKQYESKLEALDDLKENREKTAPSPYPEHMVDEKGYFNPDYMEYEKQRIIDSVYQEGLGRRGFEKQENFDTKGIGNEQEYGSGKDTLPRAKSLERDIGAQEPGLGHRLFFSSDPLSNPESGIWNGSDKILVRVDGTQTVQKDHRLKMRTERDAMIGGRLVLKNTPVYGFVSFKPNRVLIEIGNIGHRPVKLRAFDLQDGSEGVYVENRFRAQASQETFGNVVDDIDISGLPQMGGIKKIFQRNHRRVKVTILDNYQLILKTKQ